MMSVLVRLSYLFFILNLGINALPTNYKKSNSTSIRSTNHTDKLPANQKLPKFEAPKDFNLTQVVKDLKHFGIHSLKEDKHIEGLPLDRQGKVNPDFHKEIFLGHHELFESDIEHNEEKRKKKLEEIFNEADVNHDKRVSKEELVNYVFKNVQKHLQEAKQKNSKLFVLIDSNQDGKITWHEYFALYIRFHHMNESSLTDFNDVNFIQESYDTNLQRELLKIRFRWTDTDNAGDNELDIDEFLAFRHPEIAGRSYKYIVEDIISQMDRNDDQQLTINEFAFLPSGALEDKDNKEWIEMDKRWLEEQKREFREMDVNKDGSLTREELLAAYDPLNRVHINTQIRRLVAVVDDSPKDNYLSLDEMQKHGSVFSDMRLLDTEKGLHDEM